MPEVELLATGEGEYRLHAPDAIRAWRVVTSKAVFGFDEATHEMTLLGVLEGLDVDQVVAEMALKLRVAVHIERLAGPDAREAEILREHIDPGRTVIGRTAKSG